ncbi:MAG: hypothetical protein ACP5I1_15460 [Candidatus Hinthialibacter sp.]
MNSNDENLVPLCITEDEVHEAMIIGALNDAGIHHVVQGYHDEAFDGLFEQSRGHSRILVFEDDESKALEAISYIPNYKNEHGEEADE